MNDHVDLPQHNLQQVFDEAAAADIPLPGIPEENEEEADELGIGPMPIEQNGLPSDSDSDDDDDGNPLNRNQFPEHILQQLRLEAVNPHQQQQQQQRQHPQLLHQHLGELIQQQQQRIDQQINDPAQQNVNVPDNNDDEVENDDNRN